MKPKIVQTFFIFPSTENSIKLWPPTFLSSSHVRISLSLSIRNELPNISVQRWPHHTEKHIPSIFPTYLHYGSDWNNRGDKIERDWAQYQFPAWWPSLNIQNVASFGGENIYRSRNCLEILALLQYWLQRVSACFREEFRIALIFKTNA